MRPLTRAQATAGSPDIDERSRVLRDSDVNSDLFRVRKGDRPGRNAHDRKGLSQMIWWLLLVVGGWIFLQAYLLPKMGVST